jgi:lysyl endopeptidase
MKTINQFRINYKLWPFILIFFILNNVLEAQISEKGTPKSFTESTLKAFTEIPFVTMPYFNVSEMLKEDTISNRLLPFRFAKGFKVSYSLDNSGLWETLDNGDKIWRLGIKSPGAYGIIVSFSEYDIPDSAKVFIFNTKMTHVIGAFTSKNNTKYRILPTEPVKGDEVVVEYFEPRNVKQQGKLTIGSIGHDYIGIVDGFDVGGYGGTPLSCEVNTICADPNWQNEKHAINRICYQGSDGHFYLCTAALINNTSQDGTPYDLTAQHCICDSAQANSVVALFNYESPTCTPTGSGSLTQTISIATLVASIDSSDCALIRLSSIPPSSYTPYYLGWDRTGSTPTGTVTCIHHPEAAVKKISTSTYGLSTVSYFLTGSCTSENKDCWLLTKWTTGDIEHGSSGAPLLNNNAKVIGQVYGDENGTMGCPGTSLENLFGRFFRSWTGSHTYATQLSHWLDPCGSGVTTLDGKYYFQISGSYVVCSSGASFSVNYVPQGFSIHWTPGPNLTRVSSQGSNPCTFQATGSGSSWIRATIITPCDSSVLPDYPVWAGVFCCTVVTGTAGVCPNSLYNYTAQVPNGYSPSYSFSWTYPSRWSNNGQYQNNITLQTPMYNMTYGTVRVSITNQCGSSAYSGITVYPNPGGCRGYLVLYPNPASDNVTITINDNSSLVTLGDTVTSQLNTNNLSSNGLTIYTVYIYDRQGTLLSTVSRSGNSFNVPLNNLSDGIYIVEVSDGKNVYRQQLIIKRN